MNVRDRGRTSKRVWGEVVSALIEKNAVVLFQGDSITDAGRRRDDPSDLGFGYAQMAASWFASLYPERRVTFFNRGISGDRVKDLRRRWQRDCIDLGPTWVSIMIGINDCWRRYDQNDPTSTEEYEEGYRDLITQVKEKTGARLILCEPFVLPFPEDRKAWREDLDPKIEVVHRLAKEFDALLAPFDKIFQEASGQIEPSFWAYDGVHPTMPGHALMARAWLRTVNVRADND